ncbi:HEAT repeat domain-containing protein [Pedobacter polaris]|uniref:HEAT repeat domain-containing protein n=1 Tax=Pedobacter polaris TaxID=2571273 RepID=A0A4U1CSI7_9SPHI|nr:HEAT repeat domain-containing protein [Pedobacter polaris]TKC10010.1 HEAT repeat domain-containing protein [Pedobacter polaris]
MNDPLKKYIEDNRDDFDNLEPSADIFFKIKGELKSAAKEEKGGMRLILNHKWLVAASIVITISITYLFITNNSTDQLINKQQITKRTIPEIVDQPKAIIQVEPINDIKKTLVKVTAKRKFKEQNAEINMLAAYKGLTDSTSASNRLAAILDIQKSNVMSYAIIDQLAKSLNHDSNSNVRLAALNLMSKYTEDSYVGNTFMQSLSSQKDPLVQLGLIELLSQTNNPKLDDKLYALANDPTTFAAVKDQAYLILLNQNKL